MTAQLLPESNAPSRRALLAGVIGGVGAWAMSAVGRANPVRAGVDGDVVLGAANTTTTETTITNTSGGSFALKGIASGSGVGVYGQSASGVGVNGYADSGWAVYAFASSGRGIYSHCGTGVGVYADNNAAGEAASVGWNKADGTGVLGYSSATGSLPVGKPKTGVFGYAAQDSSSRGVWGESPAGIGLYGRTTTGYAGYFHGKVFTDSFHELSEMATPAAPGANRARLFVRDVGGKTQLCVRFATGSVKLIAQEA